MKDKGLHVLLVEVALRRCRGAGTSAGFTLLSLSHLLSVSS